jgi:hypothetical protein
MGVIAGSRSGKEKSDVKLKHRIDGDSFLEVAFFQNPVSIQHFKQ